MNADLQREDEEIRKEFPILTPDEAYLDNSATVQKPQCVLEAMEKYYREMNANPLRGLYGLSVKATDAYESAREAVRSFINADSTEEIIFTPVIWLWLTMEWDCKPYMLTLKMPQLKKEM